MIHNSRTTLSISDIAKKKKRQCPSKFLYFADYKGEASAPLAAPPYALDQYQSTHAVLTKKKSGGLFRPKLEEYYYKKASNASRMVVYLSRKVIYSA